MKISFPDKSYIEIKKSNEADKVVILISSRDAENPRVKITNSCEITMKEFKSLMADIS
jgi:hypothetical protein